MISLSVESTFLIGDPIFLRINTDLIGVNFTISLYLNGVSYVGDIMRNSPYADITWIPPLEDIGSQIPNDNTIVVSFMATINSKDTGTLVDMFVSDLYTLTMPPYQPTIGTVSTEKKLLDKDGNQLNWSQILQRLTEITTSLRTSQISGLYGASVLSVTFAVGGKTYNGIQSGNTYSASVGKLSSSGRIGVSVTVTDSRGRTGSKTVYIDVTAYNPPDINNVRLYRCDSAGVESDTGAYLYAYADVAYTQIGTNAVKLYAGYKLLSASRYTEFEITPGEANIISAGLSSESNYDIVLYAEDLFERSDQQHDVITTEMITLHMKNGGKAVGIGMYVTNEADESVHIAWDTRVYGKMTANSIQVGDQVLTESDVQRLLSLLS